MPTLTIDLTAGEAAKVSAAVGFLEGLGRDATMAEVRAHYLKAMKTDVHEAERIIAKRSFVPSTFEPT